MTADVYLSLMAFTGGAQKLAQSMNIRLQRARARAERIASQHGHTLDPWSAVTVCHADESARCAHCHRTVMIVLGVDPELSGSALTMKCKTL